MPLQILMRLPDLSVSEHATMRPHGSAQKRNCDGRKPMFQNLRIEDTTSDRFQAQIFEHMLALILVILGVGLIMAGILNIYGGDIGTGSLCLVIAALLAGGFLYFVGVRRITIGVQDDRILMTTRTVLRDKKLDLTLSEVSHVRFSRSASGHIVDVPPGEPYKAKWIYTIGFTLHEGTDHLFYDLKGKHVYDLGLVLLAWLENNTDLKQGATRQAT